MNGLKDDHSLNTSPVSCHPQWPAQILPDACSLNKWIHCSAWSFWQQVVTYIQCSLWRSKTLLPSYLLHNRVNPAASAMITLYDGIKDITVKPEQQTLSSRSMKSRHTAWDRCGPHVPVHYIKATCACIFFLPPHHHARRYTTTPHVPTSKSQWRV